jgi:polar amino acid transport system substrate-binding protein
MHTATSRRDALHWLGVSALLSGAACSSQPPLSGSGSADSQATNEALRRGFAATGVLRASINVGNPILASRSDAGQATGVSVDLARGLATHLGVPLQLLVFDAAAKSVDAVKTGQADIGFFAIDPLRGDGIRFSAPYVLIEGAYLVKQASPLTDNAQVDRAGIKVMAAKGSAYDLYLSRELKAAQILRTTTSQAVVDSFLAENADVAAGVKQQLQADAQRLPGLRLLPGRFMVIEQAMGVQAGRGDAVEAALRAYVERAKASGFVAAALQRHGIQGAIVAPAAPAA